MLSTETIQTLVDRLDGEGPDALLTLSEAAAVVGERVMDKHDDLHSARKRVGMQMQRSMMISGDVTAGGLSCRDDGLFTCDEIARWANRRYPGRFDDLPTKPRNVPRVSVIETAHGSTNVKTEWEPIDPTALRTLLRAARQEITQRDADDEKKERERKEELVRRFGKGKKEQS